MTATQVPPMLESLESQPLPSLSPETATPPLGVDVQLDGVTMPETVATLRALQFSGGLLHLPGVRRVVERAAEDTAHNVHTIAALACNRLVQTDFSGVPEPEVEYVYLPEERTVDFSALPTIWINPGETRVLSELLILMPAEDPHKIESDMAAKMAAHAAKRQSVRGHAEESDSEASLAVRIDPGYVDPVKLKNKLQAEASGLSLKPVGTTWFQRRIIHAALRRYASHGSGYDRAVALSAIAEQSSPVKMPLEKIAVYTGVAIRKLFGSFRYAARSLF